MRKTRLIGVVAIGLVGALALSACSSDPTNPAPSNSANVPAATGSGSSAPTGSVDASGSATGASASGSQGAGEPGTGPSGEAAEPGQAAAAAAGSLNIFLYQKPNGLFNPLAPASGPDNEVISLMYESLLDADPATGELVPVLAESLPEVSEDSKTFTFKLRKGILWSDGKPFSSKDVLASMQLAADPAMENGPFVAFTNVKGYKDREDGKTKSLAGLTAPDDDTFVITLDKASNGQAGLIALLRILPAHIISGLKVKTFTKDPYFQKPTVGTGPYVFTKYQTDQSVQLTANPNFRYKVGVKEIFLKILTADVATSQLQTGEIDVTNIAPVDNETVKGFPDTTVTPRRSPGFVRAAWNQSQKRFQDPRVLQAFLYGTDRKAIIEGALKGEGAPRNSVYGDPWLAQGLEQYDYNPEKAKQLLAEAKWDPAQEVKLSWIAGGNPDRDAAAQILQSQLKEVGINLKLDQVQAQWFTDNVPKGKFDMIIYGGGNYTANPYNAIPVTSCQEPGMGPNNGLFCDKEYQTLAEKADATADADERKTLYQDASKLENAHPSQMWLYSPNILWAKKNAVTNFTPPQDLGANWWEAWKWAKAA